MSSYSKVNFRFTDLMVLPFHLCFVSLALLYVVTVVKFVTVVFAAFQ